jgi:protein FAM32A
LETVNAQAQLVVQYCGHIVYVVDDVCVVQRILSLRSRAGNAPSKTSLLEWSARPILVVMFTASRIIKHIFYVVDAMAPSSDYSITPSTGKLKLKGVKDSKVNKKKKKKPKTENEGETREDDFQDRSVMLKMLEEEDRSMSREKSDTSSAANRDEGSAVSEKVGEVPSYGESIKTEAERRYDEQRRKRVSPGSRRCNI